MRVFTTLLTLAACTLATSDASAIATINVGDHLLLPNTPHQPIPIYVSGAGNELQGIELYAQIGDGGPPVGGSTLAPGFDGSDILTDTIFARNNTGQSVTSTGYGNLVSWLQTTTSAGFADGAFNNGLIATLYVSTVGWHSPQDQTFPLVLSAGDGSMFPLNAIGSTMLYGPRGDIGLQIFDGHITAPKSSSPDVNPQDPALPEPSTFALAAMGILCLMARIRRWAP